MARSFGAESIGADGFVVRGPVSAAPSVGCALVELGSNQLGWTSRPVVISPAVGPAANSDYLSPIGWTPLPTVDLSSRVAKSGDSMSGPLTGPTYIQIHSGVQLYSTLGNLAVKDSTGTNYSNILAQSVILTGSVSTGHAVLGDNGQPAYSFSNAGDTYMTNASTTPGSRAINFFTDGAQALSLGGSGTSRAATFSGNILPSTHNTFDLGTSGTKFRNAYFTGTVSATDVLLFNGLSANILTANTLGIASTITQGSSDARWTVTATGKRDSQVGNGSGTWQTGYREAYNVAGVQCGFFGATPVSQPSIAVAATDVASTQTLANSLRTAFLALGLGV